MILSSRKWGLAGAIEFSFAMAVIALPSSITTAATLVDVSKAGRCWSSWNNYRSAEESYDQVDQPKSYTYIPTFLSTYINYTTLEDTTALPMTTLCDGWPRAIRSRTLEVIPTCVETHYYVDSYFPITSTVIRTDVKPDCSVRDGSRVCSRLWSSCNVVSSSYLHEGDYDNVRFVERRTPPCVEPDQDYPTASENQCIVRVEGSATMCYWSTTTVSGDFCKGAPNTIEYGDVTFTSPSVYLVIDSASANWAERTRFSGRRSVSTFVHGCGPAVTAVTLTLDPTDLSTIEQGDFTYNGDSYSVNWADFNTLAVPMSAYQFQCNSRLHRKYDRSCPQQTVIYDNYSPWFKIPQEMVSEADAWLKWNYSDESGLRPKMVSIEPQMTSMDENEEHRHRHKGILTAKPTGTPSHHLAWATATSGSFGPSYTSNSNREENEGPDNLNEAGDNNATDNST
ncbi:hypothetical protein G7Y89_g4915 [Cudoniella acicularis]|uniref:Uncharacterized protein n=1 Tax=Cudoniella acicularis TaxID=354080 RepID=A0A8H4W6Z7_9HELO|nr:hypothetical protein G7Y89_g4915 [Cudoniella acicularis]